MPGLEIWKDISGRLSSGIRRRRNHVGWQGDESADYIYGRWTGTCFELSIALACVAIPFPFHRCAILFIYLSLFGLGMHPENSNLSNQQFWKLKFSSAHDTWFRVAMFCEIIGMVGKWISSLSWWCLRLLKIGAKDSMSLIRYPDLKFGRILAVGWAPGFGSDEITFGEEEIILEIRWAMNRT